MIISCARRACITIGRSHLVHGSLKADAIQVQMLDNAYLDKYYRQARWGPNKRSLFDLELLCMADAAMTPFRSRSLDMRVISGQSALFYTVSLPYFSACARMTLHTACCTPLISMSRTSLH